MSPSETLPRVVQRFLRYVQIDTQSDPTSTTVPTTEKQKDLSRLLVQELRAMGVTDAEMDEYGYVYATLPSPLPHDIAEQTPVLALIAHIDTSPDETGTGVRPLIHENYQGQVIMLPGDSSVHLDPKRDPALLDHIGHDLITSDGTTLLGSDDKAGVALIMQFVEDALTETPVPRPTVRICFTVDEEVGRGVDKLDLERLGAEVAYTMDGGGTHTLSSETFNAASAVVTVQGVAVHPGYAKDLMVNAVRILADFIAALPSDEAPETTSGREGYYHPHHTTAGEAQRAEVHLLLRDFSTEGLEARKHYVRDLVDQLRDRYPGAQIDLTITDSYKNMRRYIEEQDPRTITFAEAAAQALGIDLEMEVIRGGTDGARLSEMGLPTPNVFTGGHQFHSRFEWNTVQNLEAALGYLKTLVHTWGEDGAKDGSSAPAHGLEEA